MTHQQRTFVIRYFSSDSGRVRVIGSWVVARQFLGWSPFASRVAVVRATLRYHVEHLCHACDTCAV